MLTLTSMGSRTRMRLEAVPFLSALRLADSAFPTGLFTQSYGLEAFVQAGLVHTPADVEELLVDCLREQVAPADGVAAACAWRAAADEDLAALLAVDRAVEATKLCRELREASSRSGGQFLRLIAEECDRRVIRAFLDEAIAGGTSAHYPVVAGTTDRTPAHYPVVAGAAGQALGIPLEAVLLLELNAFAASFTSAAMRLLRYGHHDAQATLVRVHPIIADLVAEIADRQLDEIRSFGPIAEIMSMHHERNRVRLFAN